MGLLGAVISTAATAGLERAAAKLPKENRAPFERTNHRGETVTLLEGPIAVLGALAGVAASRSDSRVKAAALVAGSVSGLLRRAYALVGDQIRRRVAGEHLINEVTGDY